jgi:hypothetical protein
MDSESASSACSASRPRDPEDPAGMTTGSGSQSPRTFPSHRAQVAIPSRVTAVARYARSAITVPAWRPGQAEERVLHDVPASPTDPVIP